MVRFIFTVIWHLMSERYANGGNARWMRYIPSSGPMPSAVKGRYAGTAAYTVPGLNSDGCKELPGLYLSESEGARYWLEVLAGLNNRGIKDILTACADGLAGFDEAVRSIFPQTGVQLCVTRQIRNSLRKGQKAFATDLKPIYREAAEAALDGPEEEWSGNTRK
ncbi:hypothetical protein C7N83_05085 [Neisseria iguanae]|uniref:Mutator family transposase n=1 Tax=Neisseria iguanae TaxID=90242 RepID=A0A2P7U118_9NEIS|nr:hypothetical protein C7N83_05085 [Neisseria iguanae]